MMNSSALILPTEAGNGDVVAFLRSHTQGSPELEVESVSSNLGSSGFYTTSYGLSQTGTMYSQGKSGERERERERENIAYESTYHGKTSYPCFPSQSR